MDLGKLIAESAARHADRAAVLHNGESTSYRDLMHYQGAISRHIADRCSQSGSRIGVCIERSPLLIASLLAVHHARHAFVPMDPKLPEKRLAYILQDSKPEFLLTSRLHAEFFAPLGIPFLCVEDLPLDVDDEHCRLDNTPAISAHETAYLIYTSGSTGEPKGVEIAHSGISNQILWRRETFELTAADRILQTFSLAFDPAIWEFFGTLQAGACMVISDETHDASKIAQLVLDEGITIVQTVPSMLKQLVLQDAMRASTQLRHVICGGETLSWELVEAFYSNCHGQLHNLYGPTETTIDATYWHCRRGVPDQAIPIGHAIANAQVFLLDEHDNIAAEGVPGEILIAGAGVAAGYFGKPCLTRERFVAPPAALPADVGTLYRTGDMGRYRGDGAIEFLGRSDRQLKIRGFRIEPAEIEFALSEHPSIAEAAVTGDDSKTGTPILVAYVALEPCAKVSSQDLRDFAASRLPAHAVPSTVVFLDALPRGISNKIDFRALPRPEWCESVPGEVASETLSEIEQRTGDIWSQLLNEDGFDPDANFFELGGDSMTLAQCIVELEEAFSVQISPGEFFTRSFRQISALIEHQRGNSI
ncbi:MAG: non-ribosomal peptide synthetase [Halioglobus sp.]|nr:non-ribosomal peptide synthetase [Halioglobus sp.]